MSLRQIGDELGWSHHRVKRALVGAGVEPVRQRIKTPPTQTQLDQCAANGRMWKGKKRGEHSTSRRFAMILKKSGLVLEEANFPDIERLMFLTRYTAKHKSHILDREAFLTLFYNDSIFNSLYDRWMEADRCRWLMPSLDHKMPLSRGGTFDLDNLHFLTLFENRAKADMTMEEWVAFRSRYQVSASIFV